MMKLPLYPFYFTQTERILFESSNFKISCFSYPSGVAALKVSNLRGYLIVLPYMGQMIWQMVIDGINIGMHSPIIEPKPANNIARTYGCYAFHSGLLSNGCPSSADHHPLHGEMPCAPMTNAIIHIDNEGKELKILSEYHYQEGFGNYYRATPSITMKAESGLVDIEMMVHNCGGKPMDLMYMCHINTAFFKDAKILQPAAYSKETTVVRTALPSHVHPTSTWQDFLGALQAEPSKLSVLKEPELYNPEFVFYVKKLLADNDGMIHLLLKKPEGDGCYCAYHKDDFNHLVRWILCDEDMQVAAFALPSSCEPEGYLAEKNKGNVRVLAANETTKFKVRSGYLSAKELDMKILKMPNYLV